MLHLGTFFEAFLGSLSGSALWRHSGSTLGPQAAKKGVQEAGLSAIRTRIIVFREDSTFSPKMRPEGSPKAPGDLQSLILDVFWHPLGLLFASPFLLYFQVRFLAHFGPPGGGQNLSVCGGSEVAH